MSITYHHSLALSDLATSLQTSIHGEQKQSPLRSPIVVIPNTNIERWLKINLPKIAPSKMALNIRYVFLEKILEEILTSKETDLIPRDHLYRHGEIESLIFQYLSKNKSLAEFSFLGSYLNSPNRIFYLASKLANYFKDYELNRASWIHSWALEKEVPFPNSSKSDLGIEGESNEYYTFEKKIYSEIFLKKNAPKISLGQFLLRSLSRKFDSQPISLHLFCLANLSDTYLKYLHHLSASPHVTIHFYQFHTGTTDLQIKHLVDSPVRWSLPQVTLANSLCSFTDTKKENTELQVNGSKFPEGICSLRDLLQGKRENVLTGHPSLLDPFGATMDASVRIWNAPSEYREVETVANDIIYKMNLANQNSEDLSLLDFSILVTDIDTYRSAIEWVFSGGILIETNYPNQNRIERQKIPFSLVDLKASDASPLYRAICDFWDLCRNDGFKYHEFEKMIRSPLVNGNILDENVDASELELLLANLGVAYEDDRIDSLEDPFQISNGIRRAVFSSTFSEEAAEKNIHFTSVNFQKEETIIQLTEIWVKINHARKKVIDFLSKQNWDRENLESLRAALESVFVLDSEDFENRKQFHQFWDLLLQWEETQIDSVHGLEILKLITDQAFAGISIRKGDYLTGGVTISLLQPMRPLPFKHVYILGLGEGKFPGTSDTSRLNLRFTFPEEWDLNRKQIQESLLWETLFSATSSLTLSYVGKNTKEDKVFEPCSSLYEIMQGLGISQATELPLVSYSKFYDHTENSLKAGLVSYDYSRYWVGNQNSKSSVLKEFQNIKLLNSESKQLTGRRKVTLHELISFIKDPLDTFLKRKLGMYMATENEQSKEEIFTLDSLQSSRLQKLVYAEIFKELAIYEGEWNREKINSLLSPIIQKEKQSARFPSEVYSVLETENILQHFESRGSILNEWAKLLKGATYYPYLSFGDTGLSKEVCMKFPAILFPTLPNVSLFFECEHIFKKDGIFYLMYTKRVEGDVSPNSAFAEYNDYFGNMLTPFLTWAAFSMNGIPLNILTTNMKAKDKEVLSSLNFQVTDGQVATKAYLTKAIETFLIETPQFFSRITYLNFFCKHFNSGTSHPFSEASLLEKESHWKEFQSEESDLLYSHLTEISKLYPKTNEFLIHPNISFAINFYAPISLWRKK
ncbi:exodeoxyribonuclease V subunit gamma [Leptospira ognonensis]|uniref:exodeoxyribonuclease V subunit gamma n=1 Tax=Leptospira ognonensis TaxID=2484945 RepID=UPI0014382FD6|nr:exodeoxyribonuclease V subunit gamma [Leptospira ognonensis]